MGLAERFKDKLNNKDIFKEKEIENILEKNEIKFISKPLENRGDLTEISTKTVINPVSNILEETKNTSHVIKFEDLESELINKIRKTPYWEEYSVQRQEKMISSYFIKKIQNYTLEEKNEFVKNILALANNR